MKNLFLLFIFPLFVFSQTPCLDAVANASGLIGEFIPQCEEDGSYSPMQCWASTGYCWCVDEDGVEIPGTSLAAWEGQPNCEGSIIAGCTDNTACNYNPDATEDDGTCFYEPDALLNPIEIIYIEETVEGQIGDEIIAPIHIRNASCDNMSNLVVSKLLSPDDPSVSAYFCFNQICFTSITTTSPNPMSLSPFEEDDYFKGYLISDIAGTFEVTYRFYLQDDPSVFTEQSLTYCVEDNCNVSKIEENTENKTLIQIVDFLGRTSTTGRFQLELYDDGTVEKKYLIK